MTTEYNLRSALIQIHRLERKIESLKSKNKALREKVKFQDRVFRYFPNAVKTKLLLEEVRNLQTELALRQRNRERCDSMIEQQWQPIETAPKKKTPMIVVIGVYENYVTDPWCVWWSDDAWGGYWARWPHQTSPTHWMALPKFELTLVKNGRDLRFNYEHQTIR